MKRVFILLISIVFIFSSLEGSVNDGKKFFVEISGNYLSPSDSGYKEIYGSSLFYPGFEAGFAFTKSFFGFAGYGTVKRSGTTPVLKEDTKSTQNFLSFGVGYLGSFSEKFGYRAELGGVSFSYKEEALGESVSGSKIGFLVKAGVLYRFNDTFHISSLLGYGSASDKVNDTDIKLGGLTASLGLGISF